ncbi:sugar kinase [Streptomyces piniterrae]|uniref:Sugar kinase n=1 Tax=Streptomyces piniterrae TaxID=2571125 RepID=A0A4U0MX96_9ACTN|nr:sugar kinase [Streptomyces piniterrae]TJZ45436.1 sugar kinase [Streptomyces piniterrae]
MIAFLPAGPGRLADVPAFDRAIGGAESNVACALAAAGHSAKWISRVGADAFGDHLVAAVGAYGVDTRSVRRDPARPTGVYFRTAGDRATDAHEVAYYRAGSAAAAMSANTMDLAAIRSGRILHLSGITAALSDDCLGLLREVTARHPGRPLLSFDVNYRPDLWRDRAHGPEILLDLARSCDLVFVGEDEAEAAWRLHGPDALRDALPEPATLVVKHGPEGATVYDRQTVHDRRADGIGTGTDTGIDTVTYAPALRVDVAAPVGAGDAFAAGFLSGTLRGLPVFTRIRHGHLMAAASLTVPEDLGTPPSRALADRLAALDPADWGTLRLGPGWTTSDGVHNTARVEVRTP